MILHEQSTPAYSLRSVAATSALRSFWKISEITHLAASRAVSLQELCHSKLWCSALTAPPVNPSYAICHSIILNSTTRLAEHTHLICRSCLAMHIWQRQRRCKFHLCIEMMMTMMMMILFCQVEVSLKSWSLMCVLVTKSHNCSTVRCVCTRQL